MPWGPTWTRVNGGQEIIAWAGVYSGLGFRVESLGFRIETM